MASPVKLWMHPWPISGEDREYLIQAKKALNIDYLVLPQRAFTEDTEGMLNVAEGRVLCLREACPMIADHALVRDPSNAEALSAALEWVLTDKEDSRADTVDSMLSKFGWHAIDASKVRFQNLSKNLKLNTSDKVPIFVEEDAE